MSHVAFLGDGEHHFSLTPELITELERKTSSGIGTICKRVFGGHFNLADLTETIRLGLIGAGTSPETAAALVDTYVKPRPYSEILPIVLAILEIVWFGKPTKSDKPDE